MVYDLGSIKIGSYFAYVKEGIKLYIEEHSGETREIEASPGTLIPLTVKKIKTKIKYRDETRAFELPVIEDREFKLQLASVTTDKKIYLPGEKVRVISIFPKQQNSLVKLKLYKEKALVLTLEKKTDEYGVLITEFEDLEEGEYEILAQLVKEDIRAWVSFTIVPYELSPLRVQLINFEMVDPSSLKASLKVSILEKPYSGEIELGLYCGYCRAVVKKYKMEVKNGQLDCLVHVGGHTGPFELRLNTPDGFTGSVQLKGTRREERIEVVFSNMGVQGMASLAPRENYSKFRGMYISKETIEAPIKLSDIVGDSINLNVLEPLKKLGLIFYNPLTGERNYRIYEELGVGDIINIIVKDPVLVIFAGVVLENNEFKEYYAVVFSPPELKAIKIDAPKKVASEKTSIKINVKSKNKTKAKVILIIMDDRIFRDDEELNIGKNYFKLITNINRYSRRPVLRSRIRHLLLPTSGTIGTLGGFGFGKAITMFSPHTAPMLAKAGRARRSDITNAAKPKMDRRIETAEGLEQALVLDLPILGFEVLEVETNSDYEVDIFLGSELRTVRIEAIAVCGYSVVRAESRVLVKRENYIKISAPVYMDKTDECVIPINYIASKDATLIVETFEGVSKFNIKRGQGIVYVKVKGPGEILAILEDEHGILAEARTMIRIVGEEEITVSRIEILNPGEYVSGERVLVYPSLDLLVKDIALALVRYPFGCAEQTSAKLKGLLLVYNLFKGSPNSEFNKIKMLINMGIERMKLFFKYNLFSLWEDTKPDLEVSVKVVKNLMPALRIDEDFVSPLKKMINKTVETLLEKNVKDSELAEIDKKFVRDVETIEDAAHILLAFKDEREHLLYKKAVSKIKNEVILDGSYVKWKGKKAWAGDVEATCLVLRALIVSGELKDLVEKGMKYVMRNLVGGMLYSTSDTAALLDLIYETRNIYVSHVEGIIDGKERIVTEETICKSVKALTKMFVRIDERKKINELKTAEGALQINVKIDKTDYKVGDTGKLFIDVKGDTRIPITKIYLPPGLIALKGGANVQTIIFARSPIRVDFIAVRESIGNIRIIARDMYASDKTGVARPIQIKVLG